MKNFFASTLLLLFLAGFHPTLSAQNSTTTHIGFSELYDLINNFNQDYGSLSRFYAIQGSPERRNRFVTFYKEYQQKLELLNFDQLSQDGKVDYLLLQNKIADRSARLQQEGEEYQSMEPWIGYGQAIYDIEKQRRRGKHLEAATVAAQWDRLAEEVERLTKKMEADGVQFPNALVRRGQEVVQGHRKAIKSVYEFYEGYDPDFTWWMGKPYEHLDKTLLIYSELIGAQVDPTTQPKDDGSGIIGNPIGAQELKRQLELEMIPYSAAELVAIAEKEMAWCDAEMLKVSREMGFGDNWQAAQEKVKQTYVKEGTQPEAMLELYDQSVAFLKQHDLLTIPPLAEETWRMIMIPPKRHLISPFFLGGEVLQIAYPTDDMEHQDKLMSFRGNNPHFARAVVHHELIAGHHLQYYMNRRNKPYRNFGTPFWMEGWALYWEMLLWDMDFPRSPEDKLGMLFWRKHRCARIIFSLNYHLGKWTPQTCIDYLVDRVGHERANAEGEVRRSFTGGYGPLYQLAYMIGALQFYALKEEVVDQGSMSLKSFHNAVLQENSMPVEMVRALLTEQQLSEDFKTHWRFYN